MKRYRTMILIVLLLAVFLTAFTPGGRGRIPVPGMYLTPTIASASGSAGASTTAPGMVRMPPRLRTPVPPFCNQPDGPRC